MANEAAKTVYAEHLARGEMVEGNLPDHYFSEPRYCPIRSHWVYAWLGMSGRLEQGGSANTTEPLFGVVVGDREPAVRPSAWEDRGFRHLWPFYCQALVGGVVWLLALLWAGLTGWILFSALGRLLVQDPHGMDR